MEYSEMKAMLEKALGVEDRHLRGWRFAEAIVSLGPIEDLETAQAIIDADDNLHERAVSKDEIEYEIKLRKKWSSGLPLADHALAQHPLTAERAKNIGYKVALLAFSEFCSCSVYFTCQLLDELIEEFKSGKNRVERKCGMYASGQWPHNHYPSVLSAMAMFTQRPCWVLRHLFLPECDRSGLYGVDDPHSATVAFKRKQSEVSLTH